jgi:hypothetical protein
LGYWLNKKSENQTISLRNITYKSADLDEMRQFMSNYHYLGSMGRVGVQIAGYYQDKIMVGMILAHCIRKEIYVNLDCSKDEVLELTRFCISPFIRCPNLASYSLSRLLKFVPEKIKYLISFADPTEGHSGTIYKAANWKFVGKTASSYFYINNRDGWKMHKKTLYNQARAMHMTESEFAKRFEYDKIHTLPLRKYIYKVVGGDKING